MCSSGSVRRPSLAIISLFIRFFLFDVRGSFSDPSYEEEARHPRAVRPCPVGRGGGCGWNLGPVATTENAQRQGSTTSTCGGSAGVEATAGWRVELAARAPSGLSFPQYVYARDSVSPTPAPHQRGQGRQAGTGREGGMLSL